MRFAGFIGPSYQLRSVNVDSQRCVNLYPEVNELGTGKEHEVAALVSTPGKKLFANIGATAVRGTYATSLGTFFAVCGNQLFQVFSNGTSTVVGTLATTTGQVQMADNGLQLMLVDGPNGYSYTFATSTAAAASLQIEVIKYTAVTAGAAGNAITITYVNDVVGGSPSVSVAGPAITVHMQTGVTTASAIQTLIASSISASALVTATVSSGGGTALQGAHAPTNLANGTDSQAAVFTQISNFPGADTVVFQDSYFICNKPNTGVFFISGLNTATFDPLDVKTSEGNPDNVVAVLSDHRDLWVFNAQSTEVFYDSGKTTTDSSGNLVAQFPFERNQGAFLEHGCAAKFSVAKMNNTVYWVGKDDKGTGMVFQAKGFQPQRVSTHAVEYAMAGYGDLSGAIAYTYQQNGHNFYCINFPTAKTTWTYDASTNMWHERVFTNNGQFERDIANSHSYVFSKHLVSDYRNGNIYELTDSVFTDNGSAITRQRVSPHIAEDMTRAFHAKFQLDLETGVGLDGIGQGTDPQIMMKFSDDGGHTWSNEKWVSFGKIGVTKGRAIWRRLGVSRDRVYSVTITDPVKVTIIGAEIDVVGGAA